MRKEGWRAGHGNRRVCPGDVQMHRLAYTTAPCNPPRKRSISSIWDCSIFAVPDPFVSAWRVCDSGLWESLHRQTHSNGSHVGNQQSAGWSKGNPLFMEGFTVFICSWTIMGVLEIIFTLKVAEFSVQVLYKWINSNFCRFHFSLCFTRDQKCCLDRGCHTILMKKLYFEALLVEFPVMAQGF